MPRSVSIPEGSMPSGARLAGCPSSAGIDRRTSWQEFPARRKQRESGSCWKGATLTGSRQTRQGRAGHGRAEVVCRLAWSIPGAFPVSPSPSRQLPIGPVQPPSGCSCSKSCFSTFSCLCRLPGSAVLAKAIHANDLCSAWRFLL